MKLMFTVKVIFTLLFPALVRVPDTTYLKYDVCIYGATSAGVIAAYSAAKLGKRVILVDPKSHVGGLTSGGLGFTDIGNKYVIKGLSLDFYRRIGRHYGNFEQWIFEPHVADSLFRDYIRRGNVELLTLQRLLSVSIRGTTIDEAAFVNAPGNTDNVRRIKAKVYIDCTYEGDLMAMAGVSYNLGRESNATYNETYNGVQLKSGHQFPNGIDPYRIKGDTSSGLLWGVSNNKLQARGTGDDKIQAYNYRICLTDVDSNKILISRPHDYDSTRYELMARIFEAQPEKTKLNDYLIVSSMPKGKTDINNRGGFSTDMIGMNYGYPEGTYEQREMIIGEHESYTKGLLYFLTSDKRVPPRLKNEMSKWGYPKDEYKRNNNWSPQLYVREARRMIGEYVMTQANCELKEKVSDGVVMAAYTMDSHNCQRLVVNGMVKNEGNVEVGGGTPYPISYRSITPKRTECTNLLVPVCLSASHIAYGSIRMEPVFMALGQAAAIAASLSIDNNVFVQNVNVKDLQKYFERNPLLDNSVPDIVVDNEDQGVSVVGNWNKVEKGGYGSSFLLSDSCQNGRPNVVFRCRVYHPSRYRIYTYLNRRTKFPLSSSYEITYGKKIYNIKLSNREIVFEGQTAGGWIALGSFLFSTSSDVEVKIWDETGRPFIADAILLVHDDFE